MPAERRRARTTSGSGRVVLAVALSVIVPPLSASDAQPCSARNVTAVSADIECSVSGSGTDHARVEVLMDGFHDDSTASLALEADGHALACAPDDRTVRSGQDGDVGTVTLTCRFDPALLRPGGGAVGGRVEFGHAEFAGAHWVAVPRAQP
ncbi:MAG: hypothetical protein WCJ69_10015 [Betaproteobacteria bacterium]|jgi:hypothetical protein